MSSDLLTFNSSHMTVNSLQTRSSKFTECLDHLKCSSQSNILNISLPRFQFPFPMTMWKGRIILSKAFHLGDPIPLCPQFLPLLRCCTGKKELFHFHCAWSTRLAMLSKVNLGQRGNTVSQVKGSSARLVSNS